jgi:hypothetical protein
LRKSTTNVSQSERDYLFDCIRVRKSGPTKIDARHLVETGVEWSVEFSQPLDDTHFDERVVAAFRLAETVRTRTALGLHQAREPFGRVEVKVLLSDHLFQPQEILHPQKLGSWVGDQLLAGHKENLVLRKEAQPALQVPNVDTDAHRAPRRVHKPSRAVDEG